MTADQVINRLRGKLADVPGATLYCNRRRILQIGGALQQLAISIHAARRKSGRAECLGAADAGELRTLPELRDVNTDQQRQGLAGQNRDRPRHGFAAGYQRASHR